jgi:anti-sigma factor (TIGR02949 family)
MECRTVRRKLSVYLDNAASEETRRAMKAHLNRCHECALEWEQFGFVRESLRGLAPKAAPEDLKSRILVAWSRERARGLDRVSRWTQWRNRAELFLKNLMRPLALPFAGGLASAVVLFSMLVPSFTMYRGTGDVSSGLFTDPAITGMAPIGFTYGDAEVDLRIDDQGRIVNYSIVSGGAPVSRSIENSLLFTQFKPATAFGMPVAGTIRLSFRSSRIEVRG